MENDFNQDLSFDFQTGMEDAALRRRTQDYQQDIFNTLDKIKDYKFNAKKFAKITEEYLPNSDRTLKVVSNLPIQAPFYKTIKLSEEYRMLIVMAEILHIMRPLSHCVALRFYGQKSWKPYLISLFIDLLRMTLEANFKFTFRSQREEFSYRNNIILLNYVLRNPFYAQILKRKVITPFLSSIFGEKSWIKQMLISLIEMKCCMSNLM